jgi:hypothetical protein
VCFGPFRQIELREVRPVIHSFAPANGVECLGFVKLLLQLAALLHARWRGRSGPLPLPRLFNSSRYISECSFKRFGSRQRSANGKSGHQEKSTRVDASRARSTEIGPAGITGRETSRKQDSAGCDAYL